MSSYFCDRTLAALLADNVKVSLETVRVWVATHAKDNNATAPARKPGRPKPHEFALIRFLPDSPTRADGLHYIPIFLLPLLPPTISNEFFRATTSLEAIRSMGLSIDPNVPLLNWVLPVQRLVKLVDLEIWLLTCLVSDLPPPPISGSLSEFGIWMSQITEGASRLRVAIRERKDIMVSDLFRSGPN